MGQKLATEQKKRELEHFSKGAGANKQAAGKTASPTPASEPGSREYS